MNRHPRNLRAAGLLTGALFVALALAACSGLGGLARVVQPNVDVTDVKVLGTTLTGADLLFQFRVDNPNAVSLVLDEIGYRLRLNGEPLLNGRSAQQTRIAASGRSVVELPMTIKYEDVYRVIRSLSGRQRPDYNLDADFQFNVPVLGAVTVPVSKRGEIPLERLRDVLGR